MAKKRKLRFWQAVALSVGLMGPTMAMSGNIQGVVGTVGKAVPFVFVVAFIAVSLVAHGFVTLTKRYKSVGSAYALVGVTLGPHSGFFAGFALLGAYIFFAICTLAAVAAFSQALLAQVSYAYGWHYSCAWILPALVALSVSYLVNCRDNNLLSKILLVFESIGILLMLALAAAILSRGGAGKTGMDFTTFYPNGLSLGPILGTVVAASLSWAGFEACATVGEDTENPKRNIPQALIWCVALTGVLYVLISFVETIGFGTDALGLNEFRYSENSLTSLADKYLSNWAAILISITAIMSEFASHLSSSITAARLLQTMSHDGFGPRMLSKTDHKKWLPTNAMVLMLACCGAVNLLSWCSTRYDVGGATTAIQIYYYFAVTATACLMLVYLLVEVGVVVCIVTGRLGVNRIQVLVPLFGIGFIATTLYLSFANAIGKFSPPVVASFWCAAGLLVGALSPKLVRRIGSRLAREVGS